MGLFDRKQAMGTWLCGARQVHPLILPDLNAFVALASYQDKGTRFQHKRSTSHRVAQKQKAQGCSGHGTARSPKLRGALQGRITRFFILY